MNNSIYKKGLAVVLLIALILMTLIGVKLSKKQNDINFEDSEEVISENNLNVKSIETENEVNIIIVDIDGAVKNPGVYKFIDGDRVNDAIIEAGGLTENAYTKELNKARKLIDGEKIYILQQGEEPIDSTNDINSLYSGENNIKININVATKEELMTLNGIGEIYANRIIEYRNKNKFISVEQIQNVNGIGEKTFEKIKDYITTE
jgi:competence protein ComEA